MKWFLIWLQKEWIYTLWGAEVLLCLQTWIFGVQTCTPVRKGAAIVTVYIGCKLEPLFLSVYMLEMHVGFVLLDVFFVYNVELLFGNWWWNTCYFSWNVIVIIVRICATLKTGNAKSKFKFKHMCFDTITLSTFGIKFKFLKMSRYCSLKMQVVIACFNLHWLDFWLSIHSKRSTERPVQLNRKIKYNNNGIYWKFTIAAKGWITAKIYNDKNT